jgi:TM2 domain-containing membrane protein YozV
MKNRVVAGLLALFLGSFGVHKFYLRETGGGIFYLFLLFMSVRIRLPFMWIVGIIDAIRLFTMSDAAFDRKYNKGRYRVKDRREYRVEQARSRRRSVPTPQKRKPARRLKANPFKKSGIKKYKEFDLEDAIIDFNKGLEIDPEDIALHFNIACAYSLTEQKEKAFYHLDRAVEFGFKDFNKIDTHDDLAYARIQDEFLTFKEKGYRLEGMEKATATKQESNKSIPVVEKTLDDDILLGQLNKLAELRKKGLLTEKEFAAEKKKLLRQ